MKLNLRFLFLTFLLLPMAFIGASNQYDGAPVLPMGSGIHLSGQHLRLKPIGLFQQFKVLKHVKKDLRKQGNEGEKASKMSRTALILLIASYTVGFLGASIGLTSVFFAALYLAAFVASIVLSIIVLIKEDNPKSRKIARIVLLICGIMIVAAALLTAVLLHFFPNN